MQLSGKVAIVTGGGSGIGLAIAHAFVDAGMGVAICGRDQSRLERAAEELHGNVIPVACDVTDENQVSALVELAVTRFGHLDVLVNNAGKAAFGNVADLAVERWDRVQAVNVRGAFLCARAAWPHLTAAGEGYVFNISSIAGKEGFGGAAAYATSKHALMGFSESLREEGIPVGIKVSAICPGYVDTAMTAKADVPPEAMIRPHDIAATCVYLLGLSPMACVPEVVMRRMAL
ncbi:MAG: SDR family NAD(P)-dependent oxidoreductase [Nitrospirota bacterium]|nr:SDR family NAD(P)-dependent oxidoreductase [Nitrospirota bacterium]